MKISPNAMKAIIAMGFIMLTCVASSAQDEYVENVLCIIPWGDQPSQISSDFTNIPPDIEDIMPAGPWAVSQNGYFVITDWTANKSYLKMFDFTGQLLSISCIEDNNLVYPYIVAILDTGEIAISGSGISGRITLLGSSLQVLAEVQLPFIEPIGLGISPSENNSFFLSFCAETGGANSCLNFYQTEIQLDGSLSEPTLFYDCLAKTGIPVQYSTPYGVPYMFITDMYGYTYTESSLEQGNELHKFILTEEYDEVYSHTVLSDPNWEYFDLPKDGIRHFVMWNGDFYTIHATDAGMVLTKYTYQP